jgi:hypothetical protein
MAGWLTPRSFAASAWFRLYLFMSSFASMARTEGKAHFTATSQGVSILFASFIYLERHKYILLPL